MWLPEERAKAKKRRYNGLIGGHAITSLPAMLNGQWARTGSGRDCPGARQALVAAAIMAALVSCRPAAPDHTAVPAANQSLRPLNLVVVTIDTLRADRLRCYGNGNIETPTLDGLAQQGAQFENAVAQAPLTPPSHASIFTGTNPNVHQVRDTGGCR